jgi:hypothetical protein
MKGAQSSSETSVLTRATRRNIPENAILHSHRRENLKSYKALTGWALLRRRYVGVIKLNEKKVLTGNKVDTGQLSQYSDD